MKGIACFTLLPALFSSVFAQQQYTIDPSSVSNSTRSAWCSSQISQCPLICLQTPANSATTESNSCDPTSLTFSCVCANGQSPNVSEYSQTLPYYICQAWGSQCVSNCNGDNTCQADCTQNHPCGAQSPKRVNTTTMSTSTVSPTSSSTGGSGGQVSGFATQGSGSGGSAQASASSAASAIRMVASQKMGQTFATLAVFGGLFFGFAVML